MYTGAYSPRASTRPTLSPKIKTQQPSILTPRLPTDIHRATENVTRHKRSNQQESTSTVANRLFLDSTTRQYRVPDPDMEHFLWSKQNITEKQRETMTESVDIFLDELKETARSNDYPEVLPRIMLSGEIPSNFSTPAVRNRGQKGPKKILKAFDEAGYWDCHQKPLTPILPDLFITKQFQNYIYDRHEQMPEVLSQAPVPPPPDPNRNRRPKRPTALFVEKPKD